jgi:endonuclease/exonuclease/phosphatase family metal-dependent hydrolase
LLGPHDEAELLANRAEVERQLLTTAFPARVDAIAAVLVREQLDLVGLQEVCSWHTDDALLWDFADLLLDALKRAGEPFDHVVGQPTFQGTGEARLGDEMVPTHLKGSNVILRRRSSAVQVTGTDAGLFGNALRVVALGTTELAIIRGWCSARCTVDGTEFTVVNTHTEAYDETSRNEQRDELLTALPTGPEALVLVGDFNSTPDKVGLPPAFEDAWVAGGNPTDGGAAFTCCQAADLSNAESQLSQRLDYVWVRGGRVLGSRRFGADPEDRTPAGLWPSDHAGVCAEIELPAGG